MRKNISSRASISGLFIILLLFLALPLVILSTKDPKDLRQRAAEPPAGPEEAAREMTVSGHISGYIYHDINQNGEREQEEQGQSGIKILITQSTNAEENQINIESITLTDENGYFKHNFSNNNQPTLTVALILPEGYKTINANPVLLSKLQNNSSQIMQFGIFPFKNIDTLNPSNSSRDPTLPTIFQSAEELTESLSR
jgi:hypothetical protein